MNAVKIFARNLTTARHESDLTQEELSYLCKVHPTEISRMEHGHRDVRISTLTRIAEALNMHPGDLLEESQET